VILDRAPASKSSVFLAPGGVRKRRKSSFSWPLPPLPYYESSWHALEVESAKLGIAVAIRVLLLSFSLVLLVEVVERSAPAVRIPGG